MFSAQRETAYPWLGIGGSPSVVLTTRTTANLTETFSLHIGKNFKLSKAVNTLDIHNLSSGFIGEANVSKRGAKDMGRYG